MSGEPPADTASRHNPRGAQRGLQRHDLHAAVPDRIGRYRILRLIGEGGMGTVYEAEQDKPRRVVALKVIRPGYASAKMLKRFEQEPQVLGRLQHPGIAQIYEAGVHEVAAGAERWLLAAHEGMKDRTDVPPNPRREPAGWLVKLYESWDVAATPTTPPNGGPR